MFSTYPSSETAACSLTNWDGFTVPAWVGTESFKRILTDQVFREVVIRTLIWAVLSTPFKAGIALVTAYVLVKAIRGIGFFRPMAFLPYIISAPVMCLMFIIMYDKDIGLINMLLKAVGLGKYAKYWLSDPKIAFYAVILIPIYQAIEYFFIIPFAAMKDVPSDLYEAGKTDGISFLAEFFLITLPTVWPTLMVYVILTINGVFQNFDHIFIVTCGGPGHASEAPATYMYKSIPVNREYGYGSVTALILFVLTMVVTNCVREGLDSRSIMN